MKNISNNDTIFAYIYLILIFLCFGYVRVASQTTVPSTNPTTQETPKPIELPAFVIDGVEQLNVKSGIKSMPTRTVPLSSSELDSLNSLEKQTAVLLPADPLPTKSISRKFSTGFVRGSIGLFATPDIEAGYRENIEGYELYGNGGLTYSGGDAKRSDFVNLFLRGHSDYIAPEKFFIFGGSRTRTSVNLSNKSYNLYSLAESQANSSFYDINAMKFGLKVESEGSFENVSFSTGAGFASLQLSSNEDASYHSSRAAFDNEINGFIKLKSLWNNYIVEGGVLLNFNNVRTDGASFIQIDAAASYFSKEFTILGGAGFQSASSTQGVSRGGFLLRGEVEYRMNQLVTFKGAIRSGLEANTFRELYDMNPYVSFGSDVDFMYNFAKINGSIILHPHERLSFSGGLKWLLADRIPFFQTNQPNGTFDVIYEQGTILELMPEMIWDISPSDKFVANMTYTVSALNDYSGKIPYHPGAKIKASYHKTFFEKLGTQIGITYVSDVDTSIENDDFIEGYLDLNISADYRLNKSFVLFLNFSNLTNSNIYVWEGYKERSLFGNFGLMWQF